MFTLSVSPCPPPPCPLSVSLQCPHAPLSPLQVREICLLFTRGVDYKWQAMALLALQEVGGLMGLFLGGEGGRICFGGSHGLGLGVSEGYLGWSWGAL